MAEFKSDEGRQGGVLGELLGTRYSEASWVSWPSQTDGIYARLLDATGNIYFAGDHLSHTIAWQHGAIVSARATVTALHDRVVANR